MNRSLEVSDLLNCDVLHRDVLIRHVILILCALSFQYHWLIARAGFLTLALQAGQLLLNLVLDAVEYFLIDLL